MLYIVLNASLCAIGAFIPVFILMYIHFRIRKSGYNKVGIKAIQLSISLYNRITETNTIELKKLYALFDVKDLAEFIIKEFPDLKVKEEICTLMNDLAKDKNVAELSSINKRVILDYLKNYSFTDYLSQILNMKFPDIYLESEYKNSNHNVEK